MCDCIIFQSSGRVFLVELKNTHRINPDSLAEKFENSGKAAFEIMRQCDRRKFKVTCILLAKEYKKFFIIEAIRNKKIKIGGITHRIASGKCNCFLDDFA